MAKITYDAIANFKITDKREVVISTCSKGGYTIAQKLTYMDENDTPTTVFLKNSIHVADVNAMIGLRDMLNAAIDKIQTAPDSEIDWDDDAPASAQ